MSDSPGPPPAGGGLSPAATVEEARERLLALLVDRSFRVGDFTLSSGRSSRYYVDCRTTTMHAEGQHLLGRVALARIQDEGLRPEAVGGLTMGADPVSYAIAGESWRSGAFPVHAFSVRKEAKDHGRGRRIEGCFGEGVEALVVDDVVTTGGSAIEACRAVRDAGGRVLGVLALVDREEGAREAIADEGYPLHALFRLGELVRAAR